MLAFLVCQNFSFSQQLLSQNYFSKIQHPGVKNSPEDFHNYIFSNSAGLNFDRSRPTLYLNVFRHIKKNFFIGIRAGIYNGKENIDSVMYKMFVKESIINNPGFYEVRASNIPVEGNVWILGIQSLYNVTKKISGTVTLGMKNTRVKSYKQVTAQIENSGQSISFNYSLGDSYEKKNIAKLYYSAGFDYYFGSFQLGVFADNIFSAGINAGITF